MTSRHSSASSPFVVVPEVSPRRREGLCPSAARQASHSLYRNLSGRGTTPASIASSKVPSYPRTCFAISAVSLRPRLLILGSLTPSSQNSPQLRKRRVGSRTPLDFSPHSRGCQASCALHLEPKNQKAGSFSLASTYLTPWKSRHLGELLFHIRPPACFSHHHVPRHSDRWDSCHSGAFSSWPLRGSFLRTRLMLLLPGNRKRTASRY